MLKHEIEEALLNKYIDEVTKQNKEYFEAKAKDLLEKRKHDQVSFASANLLFKSLNLNIDSYLTKSTKAPAKKAEVLSEEAVKTSDS